MCAILTIALAILLGLIVLATLIVFANMRSSQMSEYDRSKGIDE